jgi:hypothetical protein
MAWNKFYFIEVGSLILNKRKNDSFVLLQQLVVVKHIENKRDFNILYRLNFNKKKLFLTRLEDI